MSIPTTWQPLPIETDPDVITARLLDAIAAALPGWVAREGSLDVALAEEIAREVAATNLAARDVADAAVAGIGVTVDGLPAITGAPATVAATFITSAPGALIPAGTLITGTGATGIPTAFQVVTDLTSSGLNAPPGQGRADTVLTALTIGAAGNGVPPGPLQVITATGVIVSANATALTSDGIDVSRNGVDPETRTSYLSRLIAYRSTLRPGAVRAADSAVLARGVAGVQRALAIDNYDAQTQTDNTARTVSVYPLDATGAPPSASVQNALKAYLESLREVNFIFRIGTPTYTPVSVAFTGQARPGYDATVVRNRMIAALTTYLSPATWGASSTIDPPDWTARPTVRRDDLVGALYAVDGLGYLTSLTIDGTTNDKALAGRAALPAPVGSGGSSVSGTVTAAP